MIESLFTAPRTSRAMRNLGRGFSSVGALIWARGTMLENSWVVGEAMAGMTAMEVDVLVLLNRSPIASAYAFRHVAALGAATAAALAP